jgi:hypothetical protein
MAPGTVQGRRRCRAEAGRQTLVIEKIEAGIEISIDRFCVDSELPQVAKENGETEGGLGRLEGRGLNQKEVHTLLSFRR